ncbi:hypothetical protein Q9L58_005158 [Maublancomyces gigas]|uniref:Uncharacterized protein n=1 Tax=Discina gigas TaxID=1032678 RepID=A0ABR3GIZ8_9PEZI
MFENFSFDAPSSSGRREALVSPPIAPESSTPLFFGSCSLSPLEEDDIFFRRNLSTSLSKLSIAEKQPAPPTEIRQNQLPSPVSPTSTSFLMPSANPRTCVRFQRQILARLQTTDSQLRCLSTLVEEMISSRDNCSVSAAPPLHHGCSSPPPIASRRRRNSLPSVVSRGSIGSGIKKPSLSSSSSSSKDRDLRLKRGSQSFFSSPSYSKATTKNAKPSSKGFGISKKAHQQRARRGAVAVAWRRSSSSSSSSGHVSD